MLLFPTKGASLFQKILPQLSFLFVSTSSDEDQTEFYWLLSSLVTTETCKLGSEVSHTDFHIIYPQDRHHIADVRDEM